MPDATAEVAARGGPPAELVNTSPSSPGAAKVTICEARSEVPYRQVTQINGSHVYVTQTGAPNSRLPGSGCARRARASPAPGRPGRSTVHVTCKAGGTSGKAGGTMSGEENTRTGPDS